MIEINENYNSNEKVHYASLWLRIGAALVDGLVTSPIGFVIIYNFLTTKSFPLMIFLTILTMLYKPLMEWRYGATLGKMAFKIKVVNEEKGLISIDQAFGRYMPWIINHILSLISYSYIFQTTAFLEMDSVFNMDALSISSPIETANTIYFYIFLALIGSLIYDKKKQGVHDKIAKTLVIKVRQD